MLRCISSGACCPPTLLLLLFTGGRFFFLSSLTTTAKQTMATSRGCRVRIVCGWSVHRRPPPWSPVSLCRIGRVIEWRIPNRNAINVEEKKETNDKEIKKRIPCRPRKKEIFQRLPVIFPPKNRSLSFFSLSTDDVSGQSNLLPFICAFLPRNRTVGAGPDR